MESVVGILWRNIIKYEEDTDKHLAKIIYDNYRTNKFLWYKWTWKIANVAPAL